jgi:hypothetical protein
MPLVTAIPRAGAAALLGLLLCVAASTARASPWQVTRDNVRVFYESGSVPMTHFRALSLDSGGELPEEMRGITRDSVTEEPQFVAHLREGATDAEFDRVGAFVAQEGGRVIYDLRSFGALGVALPEGATLQLLEDPAVERIEVDKRAVTFNVQQDHRMCSVLPWGLDFIDGTVNGRFQPLQEASSDVVPVRIFLLDTGIRADHLQFCEGAEAPGCTSRVLAACSTNLVSAEAGYGPPCNDPDNSELRPRCAHRAPLTPFLLLLARAGWGNQSRASSGTRTSTAHTPPPLQQACVRAWPRPLRCAQCVYWARVARAPWPVSLRVSPRGARREPAHIHPGIPCRL